MAPALTQTEPPSLADTTCHTPDSSTNTPLSYDNLKTLKLKSPQNSKEFCESEQTLTSNGDCVSPNLAPPACGWAVGRLLPKFSPTRNNMDEHSPLPLSNIGNTHTSSVQTFTSISNMGLQTHVANFQATSSIIEKDTEAVTISNEEASTGLGNQNELLALVGKDFDNVNEIIDTLQRLASNPELLDAAAGEFEPQSSNNSHSAQSQNQASEDCATFTLKRLGERQRKLERRRQFLLRRLRRGTARGLGMTISSQINYMTRHVGGLIEDERMKKQQSVKEKVDEPIGLEMLHKESMKAMSTSDLISLVRRVEASNNIQRLNDMTRKTCSSEEILTIPTPLAAELDTVASEMKGAVLTHVCHDSDATESSSGGESCDEMEIFDDLNTDYKPVKERAFYKYCRNRGWIASKWIWLQAQIADLDYRILQQQKIYAHIHKNKGVIQLAEEPQHVKGQIHLRRSPAHLDTQDPALTCISSLGPRTVLNGYHPSTKIEDMNINGYSPHGHECLNGGCARTLGIHKIKRRRYIRPNIILKRSVEGFSKNSTNKFIKMSSILCKCVPPLTCVLCVKFRTNEKILSNSENYFSNFGKLKANSSLSYFEKLSKNDSGFHSVLSKISEIEQREIYSSLLKSSDWQQKCLVCKPMALYQRESLSSGVEIPDHPITKRKKKDKEHKSNGRRKHSREDSKDGITLKIKKAMLLDTKEQENTLREAKRKLEISEISGGGEQKIYYDEELGDYDDESGSWQMSISGSANSSPCPSPALLEKGSKGGQNDLKNNRKQPGAIRQKQNSTSSSYDINNIVIPYSMAAASRVELIQYKEIPTPKWRLEEIYPMSPSQRNDADLEMVEDVSDEAIAIRHRKSEIEEHKKYLNYYNSLSKAARSSRARRADSSGTNTPDHPLSPRPSESVLESSPVGSPADTPIPSQCGVPSDNASTVLTLSLSALKSSLLKSNHQISLEPEELNDYSFINLSSPKSQPKTVNTPPSTSILEKETPLLPASRTRRSHSTSFTLSHPLDKPRLSSLSEEQCDKERVSPFPSRNFPLKENEYQDLVCVIDDDDSNNKSNTNYNDSDDESSIVNSSHSGERDTNCTPSLVDAYVEEPGEKDTKMDNFSVDEESGRGSPLSELTDSAPEQEQEEEEEGSWQQRSSAAPPDWTISAVNDPCGGFVLTVQKN